VLRWTARLECNQTAAIQQTQDRHQASLSSIKQVVVGETGVTLA
jgi:hypothetical protein